MRLLRLAPIACLLCLIISACARGGAKATPNGQNPASTSESSNMRRPAEQSGTTTITTQAPDGTLLHADLYSIGKPNAPILLLFHQAGASRGEYLTIAPKLNQLGYNCLALDARSGAGGERWSKIANETSKQFATQQGYWEAKPDLEYAFTWARELGFTGKLGIWGSSYSAALALVIAGEGRLKPDVVLSFSPGEYLLSRSNEVRAELAEITVPTFLTGPRSEEAAQLAPFKIVAPSCVEVYVQITGVHGSSALFAAPDAATTWVKVTRFLETHLPTSAAN